MSHLADFNLFSAVILYEYVFVPVACIPKKQGTNCLPDKKSFHAKLKTSLFFFI